MPAPLEKVRDTSEESLRTGMHCEVVGQWTKPSTVEIPVALGILDRSIAFSLTVHHSTGFPPSQADLYFIKKRITSQPSEARSTAWTRWSHGRSCRRHVRACMNEDKRDRLVFAFGYVRYRQGRPRS